METRNDSRVSDAGAGIYNVTRKSDVQLVTVVSDKERNKESASLENKNHHEASQVDAKWWTSRLAQQGKIEIIREQDDPEYIVYIDDNNNLRWLFGKKISGCESKRAMMEVRHSAATPVKYLKHEHYDSWTKMLAHAISLIAEGQAKFAMEIITRANRFVRVRAKEKARVWVVESSILVSVFFFIACLIGFILTFGENISISVLLAAMGFGVIGAQFSILTRLDNMDIDPSAGRAVYSKDGFIRIMTGMFAAIIAYVALKSQVVFGFIDINELGKELVDKASAAGNQISGALATDVLEKSTDEENVAHAIGLNGFLNNKDFWVMAIMATLAGFSERFVPSFLGKMEDKTLAGIEEKIGVSKDSVDHPEEIESTPVV